MRSTLHGLAAAIMLGTAAYAAAPGPGPAPFQPDDHLATSKGDLVIHPANHAGMVLTWAGKTIYVDPVGTGYYQDLKRPDLILITDIHADHMDAGILLALGAMAPIVAPKAVQDALPPLLKSRVRVLDSGSSTTVATVPITAVAAYNTTPDRAKFHQKGRGVGYVLNLGGKRIYIAGDTEPTPEMNALKNVDVAFLPMNMPYTMTEEQAAEAVKSFRPKIVYPYHSRGSDTAKFKALVGNIADVRLRAWY